MTTPDPITRLNGHEIAYQDHRFVCRRCGARLLNMMQFQTRECPGTPDPRWEAPPGTRITPTRTPDPITPGPSAEDVVRGTDWEEVWRDADPIERVTLTEAEAEQIDQFMSDHMHGHAVSNSVNYWTCDAQCRKAALKRAVEPIVSDRLRAAQADAFAQGFRVGLDADFDSVPPNPYRETP